MWYSSISGSSRKPSFSKVSVTVTVFSPYTVSTLRRSTMFSPNSAASRISPAARRWYPSSAQKASADRCSPGVVRRRPCIG